MRQHVLKFEMSGQYDQAELERGATAARVSIPLGPDGWCSGFVLYDAIREQRGDLGYTPAPGLDPVEMIVPTVWLDRSLVPRPRPL
jgi:hypothetical protein